MPGSSKTVLLLSSNARPQYAADIQTALALPVGSMIKFRYHEDLVVPDIDRDVARGVADGIDAILAFIADAESDHPFVVPVRHAWVVRARRAGKVFGFNLRIGEYIALDKYPSSRDEIIEFSRRFVAGLKSANSDKYHPAVYSFPDLPAERSNDPDEDWQRAITRLSLHSTFESSYFMRVDPPVTQNGELLRFDEKNRLVALDRKSFRMPTSFYSTATAYDIPGSPRLSCLTDREFLRVSSASEYDVALRYDTVEFWIHPTSLDFETLSQLTISLRSEHNESVPATAPFDVVVRRSKSRIVARVITTALGALLVALPAILGPGSALELRVASAIFGAALLAVASVVMNAGK